jgi:hypothetical protein
MNPTEKIHTLDMQPITFSLKSYPVSGQAPGYLPGTLGDTACNVRMDPAAPEPGVALAAAAAEEVHIQAPVPYLRRTAAAVAAAVGPAVMEEMRARAAAAAPPFYNKKILRF